MAARLATNDKSLRRRARFAEAFPGHMPVSKELPYQWYDTPNVHHCTLVSQPHGNTIGINLREDRDGQVNHVGQFWMDVNRKCLLPKT